MTSLPEDILLEIMKYAPKDISSSCKSLRNKFNIYDHWILDREKNVDFLTNVISFTHYYIFGKSKKETSALDKTRVIKLKISNNCDNIESYNNVREIKMEKPLPIFLSKDLNKLKKVYFSEANSAEWISDIWVIEQLMHKNKNLEIEVERMSVSTLDHLKDLIIEKLKILILFIYFPVTKEVLDIFMNDINCNLLNVQGVANTYNILNNYTGTKPGKKVRVICLNNAKESDFLKNINKNWIELMF